MRSHEIRNVRTLSLPFSGNVLLSIQHTYNNLHTSFALYVLIEGCVSHLRTSVEGLICLLPDTYIYITYRHICARRRQTIIDGNVARILRTPNTYCILAHCVCVCLLRYATLRIYDVLLLICWTQIGLNNV